MWNSASRRGVLHGERTQVAQTKLAHLSFPSLTYEQNAGETLSEGIVRN